MALRGVFQFVSGDLTGQVIAAAFGDVVEAFAVLCEEIGVEENSAAVTDVVASVVEVLREHGWGQDQFRVLEGFEDTVVCLSHPVNPRPAHSLRLNRATKVATITMGGR